MGLIPHIKVKHTHKDTCKCITSDRIAISVVSSILLFLSFILFFTCPILHNPIVCVWLTSFVHSFLWLHPFFLLSLFTNSIVSLSTTLGTSIFHPIWKTTSLPPFVCCCHSTNLERGIQCIIIMLANDSQMSCHLYSIEVNLFW